MEEERWEHCSGFRGTPLHLGVSGFVLCMVLDLMKERCVHRGIYSVRRDRGLRFEWDCEGLSLRCLPGLGLHLGERNRLAV